MTVHDGPDPPRLPGRKQAGSTERLLVEIVRGQTVIAAAGLANMSEETARRRLKQPEVATQLAELRASMITTTADRLASLSHGCAVILGEIAADKTVAAGVRVQACQVVIARAEGARDAAFVEARLLELEAMAARQSAFQQGRWTG